VRASLPRRWGGVAGGGADALRWPEAPGLLRRSRPAEANGSPAVSGAVMTGDMNAFVPVRQLRDRYFSSMGCDRSMTALSGTIVIRRTRRSHDPKDAPFARGAWIIR
jgi:hypothetical protein